MQRRHFLKSSAALLTALPMSRAFAAESAPGPLSTLAPATARMTDGARELAPILASPDRIIEMNVCTRPFRAQGPRIESERFGRKTIVHNYGAAAAVVAILGQRAPGCGLGKADRPQ
ncbi:MAG: hypothetical protein ACE37N_09575 [Pseudohongiellaceae bacterium]